MFGAKKNTAPPQSPLGQDVRRAASNEQARPVPYLVGKDRIGITWISQPFDKLVTPITQTVGKQKSKTGNNYYAGIAGLIGFGPFDALHDVLLNGFPVYTSTTVVKVKKITRVVAVATVETTNAHGLANDDVVVIAGAEQPEYNGSQTVTVIDATHFTFAVTGTPVTPATGSITFRVRLDPVPRDIDNPDFVDITIPDYGVMRVYWGTETQLQDDYLQTSGVQHPAYRGFGYVVLNQFFLGFNQTNFQNLEVIMARYPDARNSGGTWLAGADIEEDANPISVINDLLNTPRVAVPSSPSLNLKFTNRELGFKEDMSKWRDAGAHSILHDATRSDRIDTEATLETSDWLVDQELGVSVAETRSQELRQLLTRALEHFDGYFGLSNTGTVAIHRLVPPGDMPAEVTDADLLARPEITPEGWNTEPLDLDRSWFTRPSLAQRVAKLAGLASAIPKITGRLRLRFAWTLFDALNPGSAFTIDHVARDFTSLVFRVTERELPDPARPEFTINFESDRTQFQEAMPLEHDALTGHAFTKAAAEVSPPAAAARVLELPAGLSDQFDVTVTALVARPDVTNTGFAVHQEKDYGGAPASYEHRATAESFAQHGGLSADYPSTTQTVDLLVGMLVQLDGVDIELDLQTDFDALADALLVFIGKEVMSVNSVELLASGLYRLFVTRERFGSPRESHVAGAEVFIIRRSNLLRMNHPSFKLGNELTFKIAPQNNAGETDLGDVTAVSLAVAGKLFSEPKLSNLRVNGNASAPTYESGDDITIDWSPFHTDGAFLLPDRYTVKTRLDFLKEADFPPTVTEEDDPDELTLVGTQRVDGNSVTIDNADLVTMLGGETDFIVIARREVEGLDFKQVSAPQLLLVTKV